MNNKNLTNPIYKKLFPETFAKNAKIHETLLSMSSRLKLNISKKSDLELSEISPH